jgi:ubiquinone/menaquinone biosynthesis C-methylase UbiE
MDYSIFSDDYSKVAGYNPDADMNLGCGLPTEFAQIAQGDSVLDLGSGAGNDCFVARAIVGEKGHITGLDFAGAMLTKAKENAKNLNYKNVDFVRGDIENIPLPDNTFDVVISNCVLNLVPDKEKAFSEIYRVLKPGGHFCISDVVLSGVLPKQILEDAEMYAGCVAGAINKKNYLDIIKSAGFRNIHIQKEKKVTIPEDILKNYLSEEEINEFMLTDTGIYSITLFANKDISR